MRGKQMALQSLSVSYLRNTRLGKKRDEKKEEIRNRLETAYVITYEKALETTKIGDEERKKLEELEETLRAARAEQRTLVEGRRGPVGARPVQSEPQRVGQRRTKALARGAALVSPARRAELVDVQAWACAVSWLCCAHGGAARPREVAFTAARPEAAVWAVEAA